MRTIMYLDGIPLSEFVPIERMEEVNLSLTQARSGRDQYYDTYGRMPTPDELVAFIAIREREDRDRFVQVQFHGHGRTYTYEIRPGPPVAVGDYLQVYSPITDQAELVRVIELGRGTWRNATKIAHRIEWATAD
jgi:hypothetical protein